MRPLSQVPLLIRKELARDRLILLGLALALGVVVGMEFLPLTPSLLSIAMALQGLYLLWVVLMVRVVQADPVRGARARWRTLPISGWALFWSKCILVVATWLVLLIATRLPWLVGIEVVWTDLAIPALLALPSLMLLVALALVTPNFKVFATLGIVAFVGITVVWSVGSSGYGESVELVPLEIAEPTTASLTPEHHLRIDHYRIGIRPVTKQAPTAQVHLLPAPSPDSIGYLLMAPEVERYLPSGDTVRGNVTHHVWSIRSPTLPVGDSVRWLGPAGLPSDTILLAPIPMDGPVPGVRSVSDSVLMPEPGSSGRFQARVEALRPGSLVAIPLEGSEVRTPRRRWQMLGATVGAEGPEVMVRLIEAPGMDLPQNDDMRTTGLARRDAVAWVLHSPLQREALLMVGRIREEGGDARTGSFRTFVLTPFQNESMARDRVDGRLGSHPPLSLDREWLDGAVLHVFQWESLGVQELTLRF